MLRRVIVALLVVAGLMVGSGTAYAEDPAAVGSAEMDAGATEAAVDDSSETVIDDAIRDVPSNAPSYRGDLLYPRWSGESPHEAFMRLAEDFLYSSEIGGHALPGHVPVWPRGVLKAGPFQIFPYLNGSLGWTNNVYKDERRRSSWFWNAGAGVAAKMGFANGAGSIGFGVDYNYTDYLQQDDQNFSEWVAGLNVGYAFPFGLWFKAGVKYEDLTRPVGSDYTDFSPRSNFTPFFSFGFANTFGHKINIDFGIEYQATDFERDAYETGNHQVTTLWVKVSYPFIKESCRIYLRYSYSFDDRNSRFQNQLDNGHELVGGIEGAIPIGQTDKLVGFLEFGYENADFSDAYVVQRGIVTDDSDSGGTGVVRARLRYRMGPRTSMDLSVQKDLAFSTMGNYQNRWYADYNLTYSVLRNLIVRGSTYFEWSKASVDDTTVTTFGFGLGARYPLNENMDVFTNADWNRRNTIRPGWNTTWLTCTLGVTLYLR